MSPRSRLFTAAIAVACAAGLASPLSAHASQDPVLNPPEQRSPVGAVVNLAGDLYLGYTNNVGQTYYMQIKSPLNAPKISSGLPINGKLSMAASPVMMLRTDFRIAMAVLESSGKVFGRSEQAVGSGTLEEQWMRNHTTFTTMTVARLGDFWVLVAATPTGDIAGFPFNGNQIGDFKVLMTKGHYTRTPLAVVPNATNGVNVYAQVAPDRLVVNTTDVELNGRTWVDLPPLPDNKKFRGRVSGYSYLDGRQRIAAAGDDGIVYTLTQQPDMKWPASWVPVDDTVTTGSPTLRLSYDGFATLVARDSQGRLLRTIESDQGSGAFEKFSRPTMAGSHHRDVIFDTDPTPIALPDGTKERHGIVGYTRSREMIMLLEGESHDKPAPPVPEIPSPEQPSPSAGTPSPDRPTPSGPAMPATEPVARHRKPVNAPWQVVSLGTMK